MHDRRIEFHSIEVFACEMGWISRSILLGPRDELTDQIPDHLSLGLGKPEVASSVWVCQLFVV